MTVITLICLSCLHPLVSIQLVFIFHTVTHFISYFLFILIPPINISYPYVINSNVLICLFILLIGFLNLYDYSISCLLMSLILIFISIFFLLSIFVVILCFICFLLISIIILFVSLLIFSILLITLLFIFHFIVYHSLISIIIELISSFAHELISSYLIILSLQIVAHISLPILSYLSQLNLLMIFFSYVD